jgi:hypothetical protein
MYRSAPAAMASFAMPDVIEDDAADSLGVAVIQPKKPAKKAPAAKKTAAKKTPAPKKDTTA